MQKKSSQFFTSKPELEDIVKDCSIPGAFVIEEHLEADRWHQSRLEVSCTVEFFDGEMVGDRVTVQLMEGLMVPKKLTSVNAAKTFVFGVLIGLWLHYLESLWKEF